MAWTPYSRDTCAYNRPLTPELRSRKDPASAAKVRTLRDAAGEAVKLDFNDRWSHPVYEARTTDPPHAIQLLQPWGTTIQGQSCRIPARATPEGITGISPDGTVNLIGGDEGDGHLTAIQPDGWVYDFWQVEKLTSYQIVAQFGGRSHLNGDGRLGCATKQGYGLPAGTITTAEINEAEVDDRSIRHALFAIAPAVDGETNRGWPGADRPASSSVSSKPLMGQRFYLAMPGDEIRETAPDTTTRAVWIALHRFGLMIGDTGGGFLKCESPKPRESLNLAILPTRTVQIPWDQMVAVAP